MTNGKKRMFFRNLKGNFIIQVAHSKAIFIALKGAEAIDRSTISGLKKVEIMKSINRIGNHMARCDIDEAQPTKVSIFFVS